MRYRPTTPCTFCAGTGIYIVKDHGRSFEYECLACNGTGRSKMLRLYCYGRTYYGGQSDIPEGEFGAIAPYRCQDCGPVFEEPISVETMAWSWNGPAEGHWNCPKCHRAEIIDVNEERPTFKRIRRNKMESAA